MKKKKVTPLFFVDRAVFPQSLGVILTRAKYLGVKVCFLNYYQHYKNKKARVEYLYLSRSVVDLCVKNCGYRSFIATYTYYCIAVLSLSWLMDIYIYV